ncbi:MAG: hypothetical protein RMM29_07775 [Planctomycetota bacterium]|nr:hypothetical protein [Planctomycetota bacterium]
MSKAMTCFDCGQTLSIVTSTSWKCGNPLCPGGTIKYLCGFCKQPSFSNKLRVCSNRACKTHGLRRDPCPDCHNLSLVTIEGATFCINRRCPTNAQRISTCPACNTLSLIHLPHFDICIKSTCRDLLRVQRRQAKADELTFIAAPAAPASRASDDARTPAAPLSQPAPTPPAPAPAAAPPAPAVEAAERLSAAAPPVAALSSEEQRPASAEEDPYGLSQSVFHLTARHRRRSAADAAAAASAPPAPTPEAPAKPPQSVAEGPAAAAEAAPAPPASGTPTTNEAAPSPPAPPPPTAQPPATAGSDAAALLPETPPAPPAAAPATPEPAAVPRRPPLRADSEIERAYAFIERALLADAERALAPIILVFGLSGSGKSTYLTMLGEILANRSSKYYFPYPGVSAHSIHLDDLIDRVEGEATPEARRSELRRRIRDLVYEYATQNYEEYLLNGAWVPATVRESGDEAAAHSLFLVTEIVRHSAVLGHLVTIETSGEDYLEVLLKLGKVRHIDELSSPLHRVLFRLVDAATGIIVLLDPASPDNDRLYAPFFRVIKDELEGRAAHALAQLVDRRLQAELQARQSEATSLQAVLEREEQNAQQRAAYEAARQRFAQDLRALANALASTPHTHEGVAQLAAQHQQRLDELELLMRRAAPEFMQRAEEQFAKHGRTATNYLLYFQGMLQALRDDAVFTRALRARIELEDSRSRQTDQVIARVLADLGIPEPEPLHEAFITRWNGRATSRRMERLRYLSLVITKSDRHPIVYPPSDYPKFKLPTSSTHLSTLATYLALLGGFLRCYNATAIGYAVQRGHQYCPGPGNSFTPVNIVEPLFDMLLSEAARR